MDNLIHGLTSLVGSVLGTASVPAIVAALVWKYRSKLWGMVEKQVAARVDALVMETELGKRIKSVDEKLTKLID